MDKLKAFIVDDSFVVRRGLRSVLEQEPDIEIAGDAATGREALERLAELEVGIVLLDIRLPDLDGIRVARDLLARRPDTRVLMLTVQDDAVHLVQAILAGARGYLVYGQFTPEELVAAVRTVHKGGLIVTPSLAPVLLRLVHDAPSAVGMAEADALTPREEGVLALVAGGMSNREIAGRLGIEEKTVKNHLNTIYSKLQVKGRYAAIAYALQKGLGARP